MRSIFLFCCISLLCLKGITQNERLFQPDAKLLSVINKNFSDADKQYRVLMKMVPENEFPKTFFPATRKYEFSSADWWCSGFYAGTLLNLFRETNDTLLWHEAIKSMRFLQKEEFNTGTHDLGFMMYSSFGTANEIMPSKNYEQVLMNSAKSLITRFNAKVGCIKSWDNTPWKFPVIIDNMMNLELLFWATKFSGDSSFYHIAVTHANTTMKNHYRPDYSSYHMVNYDPNTGNVIGKITVQGYADSSAWARGQAWGLYGYTVAYRETKDNKYLQQAEHIADFILHHPNYPSDGIPYWDFNVPNIPHALRDASAASVLASALLELYKYVDLPHAKNYVAAAEKIITTLSSPQYKAVIGTNGGFILEHSVGHMPSKSEIDVPLTYADYYFVEAMMRYRNLGK